MTSRAGRLSGLVVIERPTFSDDRGRFRELWRATDAAHAAFPAAFVQDNVSWSRLGVLRGLHFQVARPQGKLVSALVGEVFDVAVDLRPDSKTFGEWEGHRLSSENGTQLYIPEGFAHGFLVLSQEAVVTYKCTAPYDPQSEVTLRWDDADVGIEWPAQPGRISAKDRAGRSLVDIRAQWPANR